MMNKYTRAKKCVSLHPREFPGCHEICQSCAATLVHEVHAIKIIFDIVWEDVRVREIVGNEDDWDESSQDDRRMDIGNRGLRVVEKCVEYFNADWPFEF